MLQLSGREASWPYGEWVIRVMTPDLPEPSGGIKVIYNYVEHLVDMGLDARVWHGTPGFEYRDWPSHAPVETQVSLPFSRGDILVMPETRGSHWSFLNPNVPHVMLCQATSFVFADAGFYDDYPGSYPGWPQATAAIGVSEAIMALLRRACAPDLPLYHVPVEIEGRFRPRPKERVIALMPRRRREDLITVVQLLRRSGKLGRWRVTLIEGMPQDRVAEELSRSAIFLYGAQREGFGLPGAEAMASGCHVIGFTGDGAKEYLTSDVASVIPDSDVVGMYEATLEAMALFDDDPKAWSLRSERARRRIRDRYSASVVRSALAAAFDELARPGSPSLIAEDAHLTHYSAHAQRQGRLASAWVAGRRLARHTVDGLRRREGAR